MTNRRHFLQQAGLIAAGILVKPSLLLSKGRDSVGLQLYTLRKEIVKDVRSTIGKVADIGFREVETYGYSKANGFWGLDIKEFKKLLESNGLKSPSGHYDFGSYFSDGKDDILKTNIEAAQGIGQRYLTVPHLNALLRSSLDNYKKIAERINNASLLAKKAGLEMAYHNHDFEFKDFNGKCGYDILLSETDPSTLKFELDLYWAVKAGKNPVTMFSQNPGRFIMWHVKDMDKKDKSFTEVGTGVINYKEIFANAELSGMKHYFVEQDIIKIDPFDSIKQSYQYLKNNIL